MPSNGGDLVHRAAALWAMPYPPNTPVTRLLAGSFLALLTRQFYRRCPQHLRNNDKTHSYKIVCCASLSCTVPGGHLHGMTYWRSEPSSEELESANARGPSEMLGTASRAASI